MMKSDNFFNLFDLVQQSFRVTIGATTVMLETLQDSTKREETFSQLQNQWSERTQEWAKKGEETEQEARKVLNQLWSKNWDSKTSVVDNESQSVTTVEVTPTPETTNSDSANAEVQQLTEQIVALRQELEEVRQSKSEK